MRANGATLPEGTWSPSSEESLARALAGDWSEHGSGDPTHVVPIGLATKLAPSRPGQAETAASPASPTTLPVSVRGLIAPGGTGIVEYVPGDGTLTALAGASIADLQDAVREGGHRLSPALRPTGTLGGTLAAGQSGPDRCALGPTRHHVLGMRFLDGRGRTLHSGGRLVKNVTGFDLHRLHIGGRGALGFILEASMRLMPIPEAEVLLSSPEFESPAKAVAQALGVRAETGHHLATLQVAGNRVHVGLTGRSAQVAAWEASVARGMDVEERVEGVAAHQRAIELSPPPSNSLRIMTRPSTLPDVMDRLQPSLQSPNAGDSVYVEPDAAFIEIQGERVHAQLDPMRSALAGYDDVRFDPAAQLPRVLGLASTHGGKPAVWSERLAEAFDPRRYFELPALPEVSTRSVR